MEEKGKKRQKSTEVEGKEKRKEDGDVEDRDKTKGEMKRKERLELICIRKEKWRVGLNDFRKRLNCDFSGRDGDFDLTHDFLQIMLQCNIHNVQ